MLNSKTMDKISSRGRKLVEMCSKKENRESNNTDNMIHNHFNEEPLPYLLSPLDISDLTQPMILEHSLLTFPELLQSPDHNLAYDQQNHAVQENIIEVENENGSRKTLRVLEPCPVNTEPKKSKDNINSSQNDLLTTMLAPEIDVEYQTENISDSDHNIILSRKKKKFQTKLKTSRKRKIEKSTWKDEKSKRAREAGKEYITRKGRTIPEKKICESLLCTEVCRLKCSSHFSLEERQELLTGYYSLSVDTKNSMLFKSIRPCPIKRTLVNAKKPKTLSFTYHVKNKNGEEIQICKRAFTKLFQISMKKVQIIQTKHRNKQLVPSQDMRGRHNNRPNKIHDDIKQCVIEHIKSFPAYESHYSRNVNPNKKYLSPLLNIKTMHKLYLESVQDKHPKYFIKECTYRYLFCTEFNLSFGQPRSDICSTCENKENTDLTLHKEQYEEAYAMMKFDKAQCLLMEDKLYATIDLQQLMPLPKLSVTNWFYLRQIWFYNLCLHLENNDQSHLLMCTWTENIARKGSYEVACALLYLGLYLRGKGDNKIKHLILWSDSCSGQNKNFNIVCLYQYLIFKKYFDYIDHKFPIVGHTYLDSDRDFGRIEKNIRKYENIFTPEEYRDIIKRSIPKGSIVVDMHHHLYDIDSLPQLMQLINRTKNTLGHKVDFRDGIRWIRVEKYGTYLYKKTYDRYTPFLEVNIARKGTSIAVDVEIQRQRENRAVISDEKKDNIKSQLKYIPLEKRYFYESILNE